MTPKKIKTITVDKSDYKVYLKKAKDFYDMMLRARDSKNWTAVGLSAVHCAISCCDAILTFHLGIRSAGEDHIQAVDLLLRLPKTISSSETNTFKRIIAKKNLIQYESRSIYKFESQDIVKMSDRFYRWVKSILET